MIKKNELKMLKYKLNERRNEVVRNLETVGSINQFSFNKEPVVCFETYSFLMGQKDMLDYCLQNLSKSIKNSIGEEKFNDCEWNEVGISKWYNSFVEEFFDGKQD